MIDEDPQISSAVAIGLREAGYSLVITDVIMPGPDGSSLAEWIRQVSHVPIPVITGYEQCREPFLRDVPDIKYLRKPYNAEELPRLVEVPLVAGDTAAVKVARSNHG